MPLVIETKQNHPIAIALREQYGSVYFLSAEELNAIVEYINTLDGGGEVPAAGKIVKSDGAALVASIMEEIGSLIKVTGNLQAGQLIFDDTPSAAQHNSITRAGIVITWTDDVGVRRNIAFDEQVYKTISGNVTLDDSYHNAICWITANAIITVPSTLRADFNCVFDAIGTVAGTFTEGAGVTFSAPNGKILKDDEMCSLSKITSSVYRLNGGLLNE